MAELPAARFLASAEKWVCDGYSLVIGYLATRQGEEWGLWEAIVGLTPVPPTRDNSFQIADGQLMVGQLQLEQQSKGALLDVLNKATSGRLDIRGHRLVLLGDTNLSYYSEMTNRDRWSSDLHLQVGRNVSTSSDPNQLSDLDELLRRATPPFDGLTDAAAWLGLSSPGTGFHARIIQRVFAPADLRADKCALVDDELRITIHAVPGLDVSTVGLALRVTPGNGLDSRLQVGTKISWRKERNGIREGVARLALKNADNVLAMLTIGSLTVRRQWFWDPKRARNNRLLAVQEFDSDLKMVRNAVLESDDPTKFECGTACLLFLLGFSPAVQLERDAPDLLVMTPGGRLALIECTTRIADFSEKLGKLVDRRGALAKALRTSGHPALLTSVLVCRLPRDQIAARAEELKAHKVILVTGEDLVDAFDRLRFPNDPDKIIQDAEARLFQVLSRRES